MRLHIPNVGRIVPRRARITRWGWKTAYSQPIVVVMNYDQVTPVNGADLFSDFTGNFQLYGATNQVGLQAGLFLTGTKADGSWGVVTALASSTNSNIDLNGSSVASGSAGSGSMSPQTYAIGTNPASPNYYRANMLFDTFVIFAGDPGSTQRANFTTWLRANAHI